VPTSTLTSKGQITLPIEVRKRLGVVPGDRIEFTFQTDGSVKVENRRLRPLSELAGIFGKPDRPLTLEAMDEAIMETVSRRFREATARDEE
jgi:antitoxin PrlF